MRYVPITGRKGERWSAETVTRSGAVTRFRGVIERLNRRLKIFKYLRETQPNISMGSARVAWRIAAILCNRWFVPLARFPAEAELDTESEIHSLSS